MPYTGEILPEDDRFHRRSNDPYWNESSLFTFIVPERRIQGTLYFYFRPNMNLAIGGPMIWDDTGQDVYNCIHYAWDQCMSIPPGTDMYDFDLPNGFSARTGTLQKEYHFNYDALGVRMDLTWRSIMEPHLMKLERGRLNPGIADFLSSEQEFTTGHYEQPGRITGTITIGGDTIAVDSPSLRDRTWGPRATVTLMPGKRGGYPFAVASDQHHFHLYAMSELPTDEDPVLGTTDRVVSGWYVKDGIKGDLVSGTRRCVERTPDGRAVRDIIEATDHLGRTLRAEGEMTTWFKFTCYSDWLDIFSLTKWRFDGLEVWGETQDYMRFRQHRRLAQLPVGATAGQVGEV